MRKIESVWYPVDSTQDKWKNISEDMRKWVTTESFLQRMWHNEILVFNSVFAIIVLLLIEDMYNLL